jgi:hypothetical protein
MAVPGKVLTSPEHVAGPGYGYGDDRAASLASHDEGAQLEAAQLRAGVEATFGEKYQPLS